jgi:hypothetical protein
MAIATIYVWKIGFRTCVLFDGEVISDVQISGEHVAMRDAADMYLAAHMLLLALGVVAVCPVIPYVMKKGRLELLLSKPVSRERLLCGAMLSSTLVMAVPQIYLYLSIWGAHGVRGVGWNCGVLEGALLAVVNSAGVSSCVVLFGVLTGRAGLTLMLTWIFAIVIPVSLQAPERFVYPLINHAAWQTFVDASSYVLPQTGKVTKEINDALFRVYEQSPAPALFTCLSAFTTNVFALAVFRRREC